MSAAVTRHDLGFVHRNDDVLANAALLYYKEGLTQSQIAARFGVSRATVVGYLQQARELNIVDIRINGQAFSSSGLSGELRAKFGLVDAYVAELGANVGDAGDSEAMQMNKHVARLGAEALHEIVRPGETIGIAWGETLHHLAGEVPRRRIENLTLCQMIGSMRTTLISTAESCAIRISSRLGADCYTLHAPAILTSPDLAEALKAEPVIKSQLEKFSSFDRTIFSVGNCDTNTDSVQNLISSKADYDWYTSRGAVGVLCGRFIDPEGRHIQGEMDTRMIGITLAELKSKQNGVLIAGGRTKLEAILATLRGGYVSHLVTDSDTARSLLRLPASGS